MIPIASIMELAVPGIPRESGDDPGAVATGYGDTLYSPRERG